MLWRAVGVGTGLTQTDNKPVQQINLRNHMTRSWCQQMKAKMIKEGER